MSKVRVCFLGTPDFAVRALKQMLKDDHYEIVGVVTQPDRPAGRKLQLMPSPVKSLALAEGLRVISPESVNQELILQEIQKWGAEIAVVVAFGQILSEKFMNLFPLSCFNIHGSLLPRWRGAAPIQRALQFGDAETGVSLQKIVKALDAGDVLGFRKCSLSPNIDAKELSDKLSEFGAELLHIELMDFIRGNLAAIPQNPQLVTYAKKIEKHEGELNWSLPALALHNKVRAFVMGPGTWTFFQGKKIKILKTALVLASESSAAASSSTAAAATAEAPSQAVATSTGRPGEVLELNENFLRLQTGEGCLDILEVQMESRNRMGIRDFLKGFPLKKGEHFGS